MGSARLTASGAEAFLDKIFDGDQPEVPADGAEDAVEPKEPKEPPRPREVPPEPELQPNEEVEAPEAPQLPPDEEEELELSRRGQKVRVKKSKAVELAQKGWDYETKMRELRDHEQELARDSKGWKAYQEYRTWMRENTPAAEAVANLLQYFEEKGRVPLMDLEGDGQEGTEKPPPWAKKILSRMEVLEEREGLRDQDRLAKEMIAAVRSQPVLKRLSDACLAAKKPDRALQKLAAAMSSAPGRDLYDVAEEVATEVSLDVETLNPAARTYVDEKQRDQKRFGRTERPGASSPEAPAAGQKEYSGKDLKDGTVRRGVLNFLNSIAEP